MRAENEATIIITQKRIFSGSLPGNCSLFSGRLPGNSGLFSGGADGVEDEGGFSMGLWVTIEKRQKFGMAALAPGPCVSAGLPFHRNELGKEEKEYHL